MPRDRKIYGGDCLLIYFPMEANTFPLGGITLLDKVEKDFCQISGIKRCSAALIIQKGNTQDKKHIQIGGGEKLFSESGWGKELGLLRSK